VPERPFDPCGELPGPGVTLLESSAGTGKTYALAGLVTRFVAEGAAGLSEILAVSFTRAAAGELKERVWSRLVSAESALARLLGRAEGPPLGDPLLGLLARPCGSSPTTLVERRQRLSRALANFDSATITTTHGFCYMVLGALGIWGEFSPGAALLEDPRELVEEVVDDLYARWVCTRGALPFSPKEALTIGREAVDNLGSALEPPAEDADDSPPGLRRRLAKGVREEVARRLAKANLVTYDGMLVRLADALGDAEKGQAARRRLSERYRVVLVDEFQDTDLVQWDVLNRAFGDSGVRLVLIGDPKQAVYSFRGADVHAYLAAKREAAPASLYTLEHNWRCDARLGEALDALFGRVQLGDPEISYRPVRGSCQHAGPGILPPSEPLRLRWLNRSQAYPGKRARTYKPIPKDEAEQLVAFDLAADVARLLAPGAQILGRRSSGARQLEPGDVAVLARTNEQANLLQAALLSAGVPAVVSTSRSVMSTEAAKDWLCLLDALQEPSSRPLAARAALGDFFGRRAEALAAGDEGFWEAVHGRLREWASAWQRSGVAGLFAQACASEGLPKRLLAEAQGERRLTDLTHIAELLNTEARRSQLGPAALRAWLAQRIEEASSERAEAEELCRRLDSDSRAVQVLTIHRAKGLEFPVVYCPYLWAVGKVPRYGEPVPFHPQAGRPRKFDAGGKDSSSYKEHFEMARQEADGEDLRQMYVAATRAMHQLVLWWAPATKCQRSPLGRLLLSGRGPSGALAEPRAKEPRDEEVAAALERLGAQAPGLVGIEQIGPGQLPPQRGTAQVGHVRPALSAMVFDRALDSSWGRLSYSSIASIAAPAHGELAVSTEPEDPGVADEPLASDEPVPLVAPPNAASGEEMRLRSLLSPWADIPAGPAVGTFTHQVLQLVDFSSADLTASLTSAVGSLAGSWPGRPGAAPGVVAAIAASISTGLGPLAGGVSLRAVQRKDRLDELRFELPLCGGEKPCGTATALDLADVFSAHVRPGEPLSIYAEALRSEAVDATFRGYLNGSLDLVFRLPWLKGQRYFVVDYKTNWLAPAGEALSAWHYRPSAMEAEMLRAHYVLQALFYLVALHRYLRWRVRGYDPEEHLGGVLYLFVRGMFGPDQPAAQGHPCGVFSWRPPTALVEDLSDLLALKRRQK